MTEGILIDYLTFDVNGPEIQDFSLENIIQIKFKDEKGTDSVGHKAIIRYKGKIPCILLPTSDTYGLQSAEFKKAEEKEETNKKKKGYASLSSEEDPTKKKKANKFQIAYTITKEAHPDKWTDEENRLIDFISSDLKHIVAYCIAMEPSLSAVAIFAPDSLAEAEKKIQKKIDSDPNAYPDEESESAALRNALMKKLISKVGNKVSRKKVETKGTKAEAYTRGAAKDLYDLTRKPMLYVPTDSYTSKTGEVIHNTKFKLVCHDENTQEEYWKPITGEEALKMSWYTMQMVYSIPSVWLGVAAFPQPVASEVVLHERISGASTGYTNSLLAPPSGVKLMEAISVSSTSGSAKSSDKQKEEKEDKPARKVGGFRVKLPAKKVPVKDSSEDDDGADLTGVVIKKKASDESDDD